MPEHGSCAGGCRLMPALLLRLMQLGAVLCCAALCYESASTRARARLLTLPTRHCGAHAFRLPHALRPPRRRQV